MVLDNNSGNALEFDTALDLVRQTDRALDYAHEPGVVHADVKPGTLIITPAGKVTLIDFGVERVLQKKMKGSRTLRLL